MAPDRLLIVWLAYGLCGAAVVCWKLWLNHLARTRALDQRVQLATLENERYALLVRALRVPLGGEVERAP